MFPCTLGASIRRGTMGVGEGKISLHFPNVNRGTIIDVGTPSVLFPGIQPPPNSGSVIND
jgi:hypothetical protein